MSEPLTSRSRTPAAIVANVLQLVSLPKVYLRLQNVLDDTRHTREDVVAVISCDPSLCARILRLANSAYYGFANNIDNISTAVNVIGEIDLRNMVLAATVVNSLKEVVEDDIDIDIDAFWWHSILCGLSARIVAARVGCKDAEIMFLAGMLHDLGILVMYHHEPELAGVVDGWMRKHRQSRELAEKHLLGFDHAELGSLLAQGWGLSVQLSELILCHHCPARAKIHPREAQVLSLANLVCRDKFDLENHYIDPNPELLALTEVLKLEQSDIKSILETAHLQANEIKSYICD